MAESANPGLGGRVVSLAQGQVSANMLEAYRRASLAVFDLLDSTQQRRLTAKAEGLTPWTLPPATQTEALCAWNAFVLQTLDNAFLDADYHGDRQGHSADYRRSVIASVRPGGGAALLRM